jgi:hypothetical protein
MRGLRLSERHVRVIQRQALEASVEVTPVRPSIALDPCHHVKIHLRNCQGDLPSNRTTNIQPALSIVALDSLSCRLTIPTWSLNLCVLMVWRIRQESLFRLARQYCGQLRLRHLAMGNLRLQWSFKNYREGRPPTADVGSVGPVGYHIIKILIYKRNERLGPHPVSNTILVVLGLAWLWQSTNHTVARLGSN